MDMGISDDLELLICEEGAPQTSSPECLPGIVFGIIRKIKQVENSDAGAGGCQSLGGGLRCILSGKRIHRHPAGAECD